MKQVIYVKMNYLLQYRVHQVIEFLHTNLKGQIFFEKAVEKSYFSDSHCSKFSKSFCPTSHNSKTAKSKAPSSYSSKPSEKKPSALSKSCFSTGSLNGSYFSASECHKTAELAKLAARQF